MKNKYLISSFLIALLSLFVTASEAAPDVQVQVLQRMEIPKSHYQMGLEIAEYPPNAIKAKHMHSGPVVVYVLEGKLTVMMEGETPKTYKAGESFQYPSYAVHSTKAGPNGAKVLATWIATEGVPISLPPP